MKILLFTGLSHHVTRLTSVMREFENRGHELRLLTSQNPYGDHLSDFEIPLAETGCPYRLLSEFRDDPRFRSRRDAIRRRVLTTVREHFQTGRTPPWFPTGSGVDLSVAEAIEDEAAMELALVEEVPDAIVVLHEGNFWTRTLSSVAARMGFPLYSFQEGLFYHVMSAAHAREYGLLSRRVFLWGARDRERMIAAGCAAGRLMATGPTHLCPIVNALPDRAEAKRRLGLDPERPLVLLIVPNGFVTRLPPEFLRSLTRFLAARDDLQFAAKWRAVENGPHKAPTDALFRHALGARFHSFAAEDPYLVCVAADCVLTQATTLGVEAVGLGAPVLEIAWPGTTAHAIIDLQDLAGIERIRGADDFPKILDYLDEGPPEAVTEASRAFREESLSGLRGDATRRVVAHVEADVPAYREEFGPPLGLEALA